MKKTLFTMLTFASLLINMSCSNDDIDVNIIDEPGTINVTVSLKGLFDGYTYDDTYHSGVPRIAAAYRVFHSEEGGYIKQRTYFYDSEGILADSIVSNHENTNAVSRSIRLKAGTYTVVTTLCFTTSKDVPYWNIANRENLNTSAIMCRYRRTKWALMSYDAKVVSIGKGSSADVSMSPTPIGSLAYLFMQNFQYEDETTYGTVVDNGIRELAVYAKAVAVGYKLTPNINDDDKYIYNDDPGKKWYYLSDQLVPKDFDNSWTFFKTDLYSYFYILAPKTDVVFGYESEGDEGFTPKGTQYDKTFQNGQMYLAYWDWFAVGNPYFDVADNNHWNTYSYAAKAVGAKASRGDFNED